MGSSTLEKMEINLRSKQILIALISVFVFSACANRYLKYDKAEGLKKIDEFDKQVQIIIPEEKTIEPAVPEVKQPPAPIEKKKAPPVQKKAKAPSKIERRQPEIESDEGFQGRRPLKDPFRVGEKVVHKVSWSKINAGYMSFEVKPFANVNGEKSYQFQMQIWSNSFFSSIYSVDDKLVSLVDYDTLVPSVFTLHVQHTTELREARAFFDQKKKIATYWEKKVTSNEGEKEKKIQWPIQEFSQNVYSALFYMRTFQWKVGVTHQFRVADDNENLIFRAKAIRKEKIETEVGSFDAIVVQPQVELKGIAKPVGDIFMWLSDDDRKLILRIESKVKIGTFVTEISELVPGQLD